MKILIIALSGIGDALMFSPALKILREKNPNAQIDLLAMHKGVDELYTRNPHLNTVYYWDFLHSNPFSSLSYIWGLRKQQYDISINVYPANRWPYNVISFLINAEKRLGHDYNHTNLRSLNFLNNIRICEDESRHNVEENLELISQIGFSPNETELQLEVYLLEEDIKYADEWMRINNIAEDSLIVGFHAGSSLLKNHAQRRWDPKKYAQFGNELIKNHSTKILLFGGPEEFGLNESINNMMNKKAIVVKTPSLMSSIALMNKCAIFVVNDSGLMHIAAGLHLPVLTIFAYTNPIYVHPWETKYIMVRHDLDCSPCFYYSPRPATCKWKEDKFRCISRIEVEEVYSAFMKLLQDIKLN